MNDALFAVALAMIVISPLLIAGIALINSGLGRARSAAQALLGNLAMVAVAVLVFALVGAAIAGRPGYAGLSVTAGGYVWNLVGTAPWCVSRLATAHANEQLAVLLEFLAVALVVVIPWGSGADRFRLTAGCAVSALLAAVVFPLVAHWTWTGGWLMAMGTALKAPVGVLDPGGAASVHLLGGLAALGVIWTTGPRRGKFPKEGLATALPGHNALYILFGCLLALVGGMAWNVAGAIVWQQSGLSALPLAALNTLLTAAAALAATFAITRVRFGKPDASLCANGFLAGLVASSATAAVVEPLAAILIGVVTGIATPLLVEVLELALSIDDPSGAITVHAVGGAWGLVAAGLFAGPQGQMLAQLVTVATLLGLGLPVVYALFAAINRYVAFRVDPDGERLGMDLHELGGGAYPEFVLHRDESYR